LLFYHILSAFIARYDTPHVEQGALCGVAIASLSRGGESRGSQDVELPRNIVGKHELHVVAIREHPVTYAKCWCRMRGRRESRGDAAETSVSCQTPAIRAYPRVAERRSPLTFAEDVPMSLGRVTLESCVRRETCSSAIKCRALNKHLGGERSRTPHTFSIFL
jgi:hypothetical protein